MRSTYYIKEENLEKLSAATESLGMSNNDMLAILLTRVCDENDFEVKPGRLIRYQKKDPAANWKIKHIKFKPIVYEKVQDIKRNFKFSVSWLIAYCIKNILATVLEEYTQSGKKKVANYDFNFIFIGKKFGNIQGFVTIWGIPAPEELDKPLL